jgi:hypothetical protein
MTQQYEELVVGENETKFTTDKSLLISIGGIISGSSLLNAKIGSLGGPTEERIFSVGDYVKYDAGDLGIFEVRLFALQNNVAKFLVSRIK